MNLKTILADSYTVWWGDWLELRSRVWQVVASGLVAPTIYILAFGLGLGSTLRGGSLEAVAGSSGAESYLAFILPGMAALSAMTISFAGTTFSICGARLFNKTFEELLLTPVHPLSLHIGKVLSGISRGALTSVAVLALGLVVTQEWRLLHPLALFILMLNCAVFAGMGVIAGLKVPSLESVGLITNFVITPMAFLGGTFFDPTQLPAALRWFVYCLPLSHASIGIRAAAYAPLSQFPWYTIAVLGGMAIALTLWGAYQFSHQQD